MGEALHAVLDVTIVYPEGACTMMDLLAGRVHEVRVNVRERPLNPAWVGGYDQDPAFRGRIKSWMQTLWQEKDDQVERMHQQDWLHGDKRHGAGRS
jgi:hypothetical protein